jgi:hypothetical protein
LNARQPEVLMKGVNENRYLLHSVLRGIQELAGRASDYGGQAVARRPGLIELLNWASATRAC